MQIKVFKAGNMKDAMTAMKTELGDEAIILHSKKYKEGGILGIGSREVVEITAAIEETAMPQKFEPPPVKPAPVASNVLSRYKTDGTAQGVANAEQITQDDSFAEKFAEAQKISADVDESPTSTDDSTTPTDEPTTSTDESTTSPADESTTSPADESTTSTDESTTSPADESTTSTDESTTPTDESTTSTDESTTSTDESTTSQQVAGFTQEQVAQTQAMIMEQFNQMQMMQQAAIAQAQAQAAEQLRLQQEQAQQATSAPSPDPSSDEKIKRLEAEIAQMKILLAEVLGRDPKKSTITLHEAMKLQEVDEDVLTEMATQSNAGDTLVDVHTSAAKVTLTNYINEHVKFSDGIKLNRHGVRIAALLGTTGVGKTTTLAKIAAKFVLEQHTDVALITADTYRISAVEQLKTYSDILELPLEIVYNPAELNAAIERHRDKELILIDTAGRSQHNEYQMRDLEEFLRVNPRIEKHLVISATTKVTDARHIMNKFAQVAPNKIIFTKIDETGSLGMIINLLRDKNFSLSYITTGQSVPDDIERATADTLTALLLKKVDEL